MAYGRYSTDPILLGAQARPVIAKLHERDDVIVRFKTNESGFEEDELSELDKIAPGHFRPEKRVLTLNLDELLTKGKTPPTKLDDVADFRQYPVLAGVAAHESAHAKHSLWGDDKTGMNEKGVAFPETIENPDYDPAKEEANAETGATFNPTGKPEYPVQPKGKLMELAKFLEEPRVERLGTNEFTKTWRRAMQYSAGHLILESVKALDQAEAGALDSAVRLAVLVGGRLSAGTLGATFESRETVKGVLESAQKIIEEANKELPEESQTTDPYHTIMGIVNQAVFSNEDYDPKPMLEFARQILSIVHPETRQDPDNGGGAGQDGEQEGGGAAAAMLGSGSSASGDEDEDGEGSDGEGDGEEGPSDRQKQSQTLKDMQDAMQREMDGMMRSLAIAAKREADTPDDPSGGGGRGAVMWKNPRAPQVRRHEPPNGDDRALYRRALAWMEQQIEPTVTESDQDQWLPTGGAHLQVRNWIRDNLSGNTANKRTDWARVSETVKPAPPVKVAVMLDGSGSMSSLARPAASIAWAAANAAAMLPESLTVSVVYGNAAAVTQQPGHVPAKDIAVSACDGGMEAFVEAAELVTEALYLDEAVDEDERQNVLIVIVSDLAYGGDVTGHDGRPTGENEFAGFLRIATDWTERGYQIVVVGADQRDVENMARYYVDDRFDAEEAKKAVAKAGFKIVKPEELFQ